MAKKGKEKDGERERRMKHFSAMRLNERGVLGGRGGGEKDVDPFAYLEG